MSEFVVELKNATKIFPGVIALDDMSIQIKPGEIHGLIGENGAGKSTLIKVLTGVHQAEKGEIYVDGKKVSFRDPNEAKELGISCVYQELNTVPLMSITDNVFVNHWLKKPNGLLDYKAMDALAKEILEELGQVVDPSKPAGEFGVGVQQMIEIAKAIIYDVKLIIMDEPTSSLGRQEVEQLFEICRRLQARGIAILFVSHKLEELFTLCDRTTVMRDGKHILTSEIEDITNDQLITAMVGREVTNQYPKIETERGAEAIRVENVNSTGLLYDVSFEAYRGEILGFSGLVGAGRTELMRAIFGADPMDSGKVFIDGKEVKMKTPRAAIANGMAFLTEDRKNQGLVLAQSVKNNLVMANLKGYANGPFLDFDRIEEVSERNVRELQIKTPSTEEVSGQLSGGNQQKVVIGKWLNSDAEVFIFDEPTRGIDVGSKVEVYETMNALLRAGKCILMVSSELPEILGMSDRVCVMRGGRIVETIDREAPEFNQEDIMRAAWEGVRE